VFFSSLGPLLYALQTLEKERQINARLSVALKHEIQQSQNMSTVVTDPKLAQQIAVMHAYAVGKRIQFRRAYSISVPRSPDVGWSRCDTPKWNFAEVEYRVDPADVPKKLVPLDVEDFGAVTWLRGPLIVNEQMVIGIRGGWLCFAEDNTVLLETLHGNKPNGNWITCMGMFDQSKRVGTHEYSTDRKTWKPTHKEVPA
jgi:hypothetical protein